jgi:hypothetical protein
MDEGKRWVMFQGCRGGIQVQVSAQTKVLVDRKARILKES